MSQEVHTPLRRFVDHLSRGFTPELAKHFAQLPGPDAEFQARLDALAEKANEGILTHEEAKEYNTYVELMDFVALLRLKAQAHVSDLPRS